MIPARGRLAAVLVTLVTVPTSASAGEIAFTRFGLEETRILVMDDDGTNRRVVARGRNVLFSSWSPNHSRIAHIRSRKRTRTGAGRVTLMSRSGGKLEALTGPGWLFPAWSPNGRWIAASCMRTCDAAAGLHLVDPDGSGRRRLTETRPANVSSWAPGSERLVFIRGREPETEIFVKTIGTKGVRRLTSNDVTEAWVSWSPGGKLIAFTRERTPDGQFDVWVMRSDGSRQRRVTKTPRVHEGTVEWAPRGGRLLYSADGGLFTIKPNGTDRKKIRGTFPLDCCASW